QVCRIDAGSLHVGAGADIAIFDPEASWTVNTLEFASKSRNSPFLGQTLQGRVMHTLHKGKLVYSATQ
ncbi:MAG TPA: dihydroorotase, partial [Candidatus Hydrogenedentes bacterium]|nr:dihydroorotase [Candidatus Hydrogenedentota bacterium]